MFKIKPLPFSHNTLEPYIDQETMHYHHEKHYTGYVNKLNELLKNEPKYKQSWPLTKLIYDYKNDIRNNAGGVLNHEFYFEQMLPNTKSSYTLSIIKNINNKWLNFKEFFINKATEVFGSGYCWLVLSNTELQIETTSNQEFPHALSIPLLCADLWEHAHYLKYKHDRRKYLENWWQTINWEIIEKRYLEALK